MGRPKGSKNKSTIMRENGNTTKLKKVITNNSTKEEIKKLNVKRGKPKMPKHVLRLTDWLYITCDSRCWRVVKVNDKVNPNTGEKYPDKSLFYCTSLQGIIEIATRYMIRVPADIVELNEKMQEVYTLINTRIPKGIKPKDLFELEDVEDDD